ncbi:hypothetical protein EDC94DRAFT_587407 [Helicostylum pulchrum]|nr:hypothetical protein EDC94DRAFT_587407 [Helicostylum pulchrum]
MDVKLDTLTCYTSKEQRHIQAYLLVARSLWQCEVFLLLSPTSNNTEQNSYVESNLVKLANKQKNEGNDAPPPSLTTCGVNSLKVCEFHCEDENGVHSAQLLSDIRLFILNDTFMLDREFSSSVTKKCCVGYTPSPLKHRLSLLLNAAALMVNEVDETRCSSC